MHFIALLSALIISIVSNDVSSLLAKHAQYVGWRAGDIPGWRATGTRTNGGTVDTFMEKRSGVAYRTTLSIGDSRVAEDAGFTGSLVWETDPNGYLVRPLGMPAEVAFDLNLIRSESLTQVAGSTVTGTASVRGINAAIIRINPPGIAPFDVYEDPNTGAFLQMIVDPDAADRATVNIAGYSDVAPGKKIISEWSIGNYQYALTSMAAGTVADSEVVPPQPRATWSFGDAVIPVDLYDRSFHQYEPRVTLTVNGVTGVFVLDTGSPSILVFDSFARRAGVVALNGADFSAYSGNPRYAGYGLFQSMTIGNSTLHNVIVDRVNQPDAKIAGYLGYDFFARAIAEVDLSRSSMQLYNPSSMQPAITGPAYAFPIDLSSRRPVFGMQLSGKSYGFPYFSTGEPFFMLLSQRLRDSGAVSASDVSIEHFNPTTGSVGYQGTMIESNSMQIPYADYTGASGYANCVLLHQALIGPYRYQSPPLCFVGSGVFSDTGGAIGMDFLRHFDWTIDYPDQKFVLTPNSLQ